MPDTADPWTRRIVLAESFLGVTAGGAGCVPGWVHLRNTGHISGIVTAVVVLTFSLWIFICGVSWSHLSAAERRWTKRGAHLIAIAFVLALIIAMEGDIPIDGGFGGWSRSPRREPEGTSAGPSRTRRRGVGVTLGILFTLLGAGVGGAVAEALAHSDAAAFAGIVLGVAIPGYVTYRVALSRDTDFRIP